VNETVLFIQNRTHRAGAQTCLARLMCFMHGRGQRVVLLCSENGWLSEECSRNNIPFIVQQFPSSRSLLSRSFGNSAFARRAAYAVAQTGIVPRIIHANDHTEGLLGLALARVLNARSAMFLRSSAMTERDYYKYGCNRYGLVIAVGDALQRHAQGWDQARPIQLIYDGIGESEFLSAKPKSLEAPTRALVIGNAGEAKGWGDLVVAMEMLEAKKISLPAFDFTGDASGKPYFEKLKALHTECRFIDRVDDFRALARSYDFIVNPSRNESFGMAAIEVLAAGVPLISSRTGVIEQVLTDAGLTFEPNNSEAIAETLERILQQWRSVDFGVARAQQVIRDRFLINQTWMKLEGAYRSLLSPGVS
jgi:glycosyltransferase involved in cell wall biosynthesis